FKHQGGVRANRITDTVLAITQLRRNHDLPLVTHLHAGQGFLPTFDHAVQREGGRLATLDRAVEHSAVDQGAVVVSNHGVVQRRLGRTFLTAGQHFILQAVFQRGHAFLCSVLVTERLAGSSVVVGGLLHLRFHFLELLLLVGGDRRVHFFRRHLHVG